MLVAILATYDNCNYRRHSRLSAVGAEHTVILEDGVTHWTTGRSGRLDNLYERDQPFNSQVPLSAPYFRS